MHTIFKNFQFKNVMAICVLLGTYWVLYTLTRKAIPPENRDLFNVLAGMVIHATIERVMRTLFPDKNETKSEPKKDLKDGGNT